MGGCNCNCLLKDQEANNEMRGGIMPGFEIKESKKEDILLEVKNLNTENDINDDKEIINFNNNKNDSLLLDKNENKSENENKFEKENKSENDLKQDIENEKYEKNEKEEIKGKEEIIDKLKLTNYQTGITRNSFQKMNSDVSSNNSQIQELSESILDYLNEIRTEPDNFEKEAEQHGVGDIIQKAINDSNSCSNLIVNMFFNLLLSSYINNNTIDGEDNKILLEEINKEEKLKDYNKSLFVVEGDTSNPNEVVWKLIEDNKDIALETFFSSKIESLALCCQKSHNKNKFKAYFLLLSKIH